MEQKDFLMELEEIIGLDEGELSMDTVLEDLEDWDSIASLGLIAFAKKNLNMELPVDVIKGFNSAGDIYNYFYGV